MMNGKILSALATVILFLMLPSEIIGQQTWTLTETKSQASLRGLSVVDSQTVWASGSEGTVLRTIDGGANWQSVGPAEFKTLDFRSLHAFDAQRAVIASAGQRDVVLRTDDAGKTWTVVFEQADEKAFFDAIAFWDQENGVLMGDPIDNQLYLLLTKDGGKTWARAPHTGASTVEPGEAAFAASGTCICTIGENGLAIALGGDLPESTHRFSRVLLSEDRGMTWFSISVPMSRSSTSGIFSLAVTSDHQIIAVGGDYKNESESRGNIAISLDKGRTWIEPMGSVPRGYRSAVAAAKFLGKAITVAVGPSGCDWSINQGQVWTPLSDTGFHAAKFSPDASQLWASGSKGRVAKMSTKILIANQK